MKLLDRHIALTLARHFGYAIAALVAIFAVVNLTEELRLTDAPGYGLRQAVGFVLMTLPAEAYEVFPAAALLGTMMGLGQLVGQSEVVAMYAGGVSPRRVMGAALAAAVVFSLAAAGFGEWVAAPLAQQARAKRALALSGGRTLSTSTGLWVRDGENFVNIGAVGGDGSLDEIYIYEFDDRHRLHRFAHAAGASYAGGERTLHDVHESVLTDEGSTTSRAAAQPWQSPINPGRLRDLSLQPGDLSAAELYRTIRTLSRQGQDPFAYQVAFWRRASMPLYAAVMVLLGMPIVLVVGRAVRIGERILVGALIGLGFQLFQQTFTNFGLVSGLPPLLTALIPAALAAAGAAALFRFQPAR